MSLSTRTTCSGFYVPRHTQYQSGISRRLVNVTHGRLQMFAKELPYVHTNELNEAALMRLPPAGVRQHMKSRLVQVFTSLCLAAKEAVHTHCLHGLLEMQQDIPRIFNYSMEVVEQPTAAGHTRLVPTWRLLPGSCTKSLALNVARAIGMPDDVLGMAQQDLCRLQQLGGFKALFNKAAGNKEREKHQQHASSKDSATEETEQLGTDEADEIHRSCGANMQSDDWHDVALDNSAGATGISSTSTSAAQEQPSKPGDPEDQHTMIVTDLLADLGAQGQRSQTTSATDAHSYSSSVDTSQAEPPADSICTVHHIWWQGGQPDAASKRGARPRKAHSDAAALYAVWSGQTGKWSPGHTENLEDTWQTYVSRFGECRLDLWYVVLHSVDTNKQP